MLAHVLAIAIALSSLVLFLTAFSMSDIHRKDDFLWSGIGLFYALVLWFCASRITGSVLLGQVAAVALVISFNWQNLKLRKAIANPDREVDTDIFSVTEFIKGFFQRSETPTPQPSITEILEEETEETKQVAESTPTVETSETTTVEESTPTEETPEAINNPLKEATPLVEVPESITTTFEDSSSPEATPESPTLEKSTLTVEISEATTFEDSLSTEETPEAITTTFEDSSSPEATDEATTWKDSNPTVEIPESISLEETTLEEETPETITTTFEDLTSREETVETTTFEDSTVTSEKPEVSTSTFEDTTTTVESESSDSIKAAFEYPTPGWQNPFLEESSSSTTESDDSNEFTESTSAFDRETDEAYSEFNLESLTSENKEEKPIDGEFTDSEEINKNFTSSIDEFLADLDKNNDKPAQDK